MPTILDRIVETKRQEIEVARARLPEAELERRLADLPPTRGFAAALRVPGEVRVIAEVKKASPSAGVIRADFDPVAIARTYERHGAACISVLTDAPYFQGSLDHLTAVRAAVRCPLLRKDFVLDRYQLLEARVAGADAVLLIAEILPGDRLADLHREATALGLHVLVELHDADQLPRVLGERGHAGRHQQPRPADVRDAPRPHPGPAAARPRRRHGGERERHPHPRRPERGWPTPGCRRCWSASR